MCHIHTKIVRVVENGAYKKPHDISIMIESEVGDIFMRGIYGFNLVGAYLPPHAE